ncbi:YCF48-related protein [candidate division KSB1 bacterium]
MKKLFIILITLLAINETEAQWITQNSGTTKHLNSVYFINTNIGYAVGDSGVILTTIDGGMNWTAQNSGTNMDLHSVYFCNFSNGVCVGDIGAIIKTTDGGINWVPSILDSNSTLTSVQFTSDSIGYVVGHQPDIGISWNAFVYKTLDGGGSWDVNFITPGFLESIHFPSIDTGYAVGRKPLIGAPAMMIKTTNNGSNWTVTEYNFISEGFYSVYFTENETGYCAGESWPSGIDAPQLFKTIDGGITWTQLSLGHFKINSLYFSNNNKGYGVGYNIWGGGGTTLKFLNGGQNWNCQDSNLHSGLLDVHFPIVDTGYIVGRNGIILKTTNGGGSPVGINDLPSEINSVAVFPNPTSTTITFKITSEGYLSIYNNNGQQILQQEISEQNRNIDISILARGNYFFKVASEKGVQMGKFIKE